MLWNAAVVLTIIVAFGSALFALATDLPRRPSNRAYAKWVWSGVVSLTGYCATRHGPPEDTFLGDTGPRS
jgi:hypothetical protein